MLSGGGTGGHIYPALALAEGIKQNQPDSKIRFVGARGGMEEKIIPARGYRLDTIDISGIDRSSMKNAVNSIFKVPKALRTARRLINNFRPDVVVGTGGYASFPVVYAAYRMGIPTAIHEQNAYPGITNRLLAARVNLVMLTFAEAGDRLKASHMVTTGLPVREAVLTAGMAKKAAKAGEEVFTLLAFGGSLGAEVINQGVYELIHLLDNQWRIIWVTGRNRFEYWQQQLSTAMNIQPVVEIHDYLEHIERAMQMSDLALCRAGASTLAELAVMGLPAILIPYPLAAENHQEKNARSLEQVGGARVILNHEINGQRLQKEIISIKPELAAMSSAMKQAARPEARDLMVKLVTDLALGKL